MFANFFFDCSQWSIRYFWFAGAVVVVVVFSSEHFSFLLFGRTWRMLLHHIRSRTYTHTCQRVSLFRRIIKYAGQWFHNGEKYHRSDHSHKRPVRNCPPTESEEEEKKNTASTKHYNDVWNCEWFVGNISAFVESQRGGRKQTLNVNELCRFLSSTQKLKLNNLTSFDRFWVLKVRANDLATTKIKTTKSNEKFGISTRSLLESKIVFDL